MLQSVRSELPLQVQRPIHGPSGEAIVTLLTPPGDLIQGDEIDLRVVCEPETEVVLRQASATRLHDCDHGFIELTGRFTVEAGARLWYLPWELIPFAGTHYRQDLHLEIADGGEAVLWEVLGPGRVWERDAARQLSLTMQVRVAGQLALVQAMRLERPDPTATAGRTHVASLVFLGPRYVQSDADRIHQAIEEAGLVGSASLLPAYGVGVRVLGDGADRIFRAFRVACPELDRFS